MKTEKIKEQGRTGFLLSAGGYALVTVSVLLLPLSAVGNETVARVFSCLVGILFWLGILSGTVLYVKLYRKITPVRKTEKHENQQGKKIPEWFRFFQNRYGCAADVLLTIGIAGTILSVVLGDNVPWMQWIFMVLLLTAVWMHFLLNGKTFEYLFGLTKNRKLKTGGEKKYEKA